MADGFLSRWSQRKRAGGDGLATPDVPAREVAAEQAAAAQTVPAIPAPVAPAPREALPVPTMEDVLALTPGSDFRAYVDAKVPHEVRNAAMKKLFADPHYNLMDGLDTYIGDYGGADPLPLSMLRKMAGAEFLRLFDAAATPASDNTQACAAAPRGAQAGEGPPKDPDGPDDDPDL